MALRLPSSVARGLIRTDDASTFSTGKSRIFLIAALRVAAESSRARFFTLSPPHRDSLQQMGNLFGDLFGREITVQTVIIRLRVKRNYRVSLRFVGAQSRGNHFLGIVAPRGQLRSIGIALAIQPRRPE